MYSSYPTETAYIFKDLHYDDKIAMKAFYSGLSLINVLFLAVKTSIYFKIDTYYLNEQVRSED